MNAAANAGHTAVIDRFEGEIAVVEIAGRTYDLPRSVIPSDAREGDVLRLLVRVDPAATRAAAREVGARLARLRRGDAGGELAP